MKHPTLEDSLQASDIGVCIKDPARKVLMQNERCRAVCGDRLGEVCEQGCMRLYARDTFQQWKDWGSRVYRNSLLNGEFYDLTLLCSSTHIISFLQPLNEKYELALAYYREKGLTQRELQVISLTIQGTSNSEICKRLSISRATLRTHLNRVYQKLRDLGEIAEFLPASRIPT